MPQGFVLGPLLFLIYINELNIALKYSTVRHFADDTTLLIKNKSLKQIKKHLNLDLRHLCKWLRANKHMALTRLDTKQPNFGTT